MKLSAACRALSVLAAWALGLALSSRLASMGLPPAELPSTVPEKLAHLAARGGEHDAIFVGSSRIQNHLMPALFDRLTAEGGKAVKSFNAGVSSRHTPEDGWFLEQILARKPARLRWVFLEIDFFERQTQSGRGAQLFDRWRFAQRPEPMHWENLGENGDGFVPARTAHAGGEKIPARLASVLAARKKEPPAPSTADRVCQAVLGEAIAQIRRAGAVPTAENAHRAAVVDLCQPGKFPDLYDARHRVDTSHFTAQGAEIFTRLVAARFLEIARAAP